MFKIDRSHAVLSSYYSIMFCSINCWISRGLHIVSQRKKREWVLGDDTIEELYENRNLWCAEKLLWHIWMGQ